MPKRLLLLLLILLLGGYFLLAPKGGGSESLPSLSLKPVLNEGEDGYLLSAEGRLNLPEEKEYNVVGEIWIRSGGVIVKKEELSTVVKGPSELPLSLTPVSVSGDASVGASIRVYVDGREQSFSVELPVSFPPPETLLRDPLISVYPNSILPVEGGYELNLVLELFNPNGFPIGAENLKVKLNGEEYPLGDVELPSKESVKKTVTLFSEDNVVEGEISFTLSWNGVKRDVSVPFRLELPSFPLPQPLVTLYIENPVVEPNGISFYALAEINNVSYVSRTIDKVILMIEKNDVKKEVLLGEDVFLEPYESKTVGENVTAIPFFEGGTVKLFLYEGDQSYNPVVAPLSLFDPGINPPRVYIWADEVNTGAYVVHLRLENPNEANLLIKDLLLEGWYGGTRIFEWNAPDFVLYDDWEEVIGSVDDPVALVRGSELNVSLYYGLEIYGVFYKLMASTYVDRPA
ncbi:MAG: hypothetical protein GXO00_03490 [Candidatus Diapherotrites archaeon]|nr:hypothetical protein [Candidatus Diapherotrites archaeon]